MVPVLPEAMLDAFVQELEKLAAPVVEDRQELERLLKPGDILYTRPRKVEGLLDKAFYALESRFQGSPHTHVGLYAGNGKVVDAGEWDKGKSKSIAVHKVPLKKFIDRYYFKVLRVSTPSSVKKDAVCFDWYYLSRARPIRKSVNASPVLLISSVLSWSPTRTTASD
jgi:cell wall-associated NlpC family hydrolase